MAQSNPPRPDDRTRPSASPSPDATSAGTASDGPSRTAITVAVLAMLVLVALVIVALQREPAQLALDTPEGTVQAWLQSLVNGDPATDLLATDSCAVPRFDEPRMEDGMRAVVIDSDIDDDHARIEVSVTEGGGGLFGQGWTHDETYVLQRSDDGWLITAFDWPWSDCWNQQDIRGGAS